MSVSIDKLARVWSSVDPRRDYRERVLQWLDGHKETELQRCFGSLLNFGTAGIRGTMDVGPAHMNEVTVALTTHALCDYLASWPGESRPDRLRVCVGNDGRHHSRAFAEVVARVAVKHGLEVWLADECVPTPLVAFSVLQYRAECGVMITASHNPRDDNGYKLFWDHGAQIVPPHDEHIRARMTQWLSRIEELWDDVPNGGDSGDLGRAGVHRMGGELESRYLAACERMVPSVTSTGAAHTDPLRIAYTALHGVGYRFARALLHQRGFDDVVSVREQQEPDANFPTAEYPNPEHPPVMQRVLSLGATNGADIALANDPDADRVAVGVPALRLARRTNLMDAGDPKTNQNSNQETDDVAWRRLSGDEVGALLCDFVLTHTTEIPRRVVISTVVSSPLVARIAQAHGVRFESTLTGFKWIMARARQCERQGDRFVFGYEEALGYAIGSAVRDKDGLSAALAVATLARVLKAQGRTLVDDLERLYAQHGRYVSEQIVVPVHEPKKWMHAIRERAQSALQGFAVERVHDFSLGAEGASDDERADMLSLQLVGGHRVLFRPSGTEPKGKVYLHARVQAPLQGSLSHADREPDSELHGLRQALREMLHAIDAVLERDPVTDA